MSYIDKFYIKGKYDIREKEIMPYGIEMSGVFYEWKETMGKGIKVGVIDTGADINHIDLKDRISEYKNFIKEDDSDLNGHGTHVCGTIAASKNKTGVVGVAPECELYVAKSFNKDGYGDENAIINAIYWLIDKEVDIINMSFSSDTYTDEYYDAIKRATENNITVVAAAGNEGEKGVGYPGRFNEVICVSAVDINKKKSTFSSIGDKIDVCAAGTDILSTYPGNKYAVLSGTSMATPIISGAAAIMQGKSLLRFKKKLTPYEIKLIICLYSDDLGGFGKDINYGCGLFSFGRID